MMASFLNQPAKIHYCFLDSYLLYINYTDVIQCKYNACTMYRQYRAYWVYYFLCALKINTLVHISVAQLILGDFQFFS